MREEGGSRAPVPGGGVIWTSALVKSEWPPGSGAEG
jgi:hypothetical protein